MKNKLISLLLVLLTCLLQAQFGKWFNEGALRLDYYHSGDKETEFYSIDELKSEPYWAGSKVNLVDTFNYGKYQFRVLDKASGKLIYSRGYSTLFGEWQTTDEASETKRTFSETVVFPFPKDDAVIEFYSRNKKGEYEKKFEYNVDIDSYFISPEKAAEFPVYDAYISGDPADKVDILVLPDGYTAEEMEKFKKDCQVFVINLFSFEPYSSNRDKFNIRAVMAPSKESGGDIPADTVWRNTILGSTFYTFDLERYCMTDQNKNIRDLAANAPYDQIYILLNDPKYGGGGIFNHYCLSVNSNIASGKIIIHELGHGFAGLGDEYYNSEVAYNDFYPAGVEPWEPNLTTLVDFDKKWHKLMHESTPIPTPSTAEYIGNTGVFEGGGYTSKGVYRPSYDCLMNTFDANKFCAACQEAIQKMIGFYSN